MWRLTMTRLFRTAVVAAGAVLLLSPLASAQPFPVLQNPGFEIENLVDPTLPLGWNPFNGARRRTLGDGLTPTLDSTHGGMAVIQEMPLSVGPSDFIGFSSDALLDPNDPLSPRNNPGYLFDPPDGPDMTVSGWFMIPASDPVVGQRAGLKLEFRRTVNNSVYEAFEWLDIDPANPTLVPCLIAVNTPTGPGVHTNGQWLRFTRVFDQEQFTIPLWPLPPENPDARVSVMPIRFGVSYDAGARGTIFWDDMAFVQGPPCACDWNLDGVLNSQDYFDFLTAFFTGSADFNNDCVTNSQDYFDFLTCFFTGCA
jgi:hypothetical protein